MVDQTVPQTGTASRQGLSPSSSMLISGDFSAGAAKVGLWRAKHAVHWLYRRHAKGKALSFPNQAILAFPAGAAYWGCLT